MSDGVVDDEEIAKLLKKRVLVPFDPAKHPDRGDRADVLSSLRKRVASYQKPKLRQER